MTGSRWIEESGVLVGPVMFTNTHSVRVVHDALIAWQVERRRLDRGHPRLIELWDALPAHDCGRHAAAA
jgi:D-aminopeptidase